MMVPEGVCVAITVTPGKVVPLLSVIFPVIDPDVVPCPKEAIDIIRQKASSIILIFKYLYM